MIVRFLSKSIIMTKQQKVQTGLINTLKSNNKQKMILTGVLAGVAIGGVIALMLSSNKNDSLKEKVGDWFCDLLENSKDKFGPVASLVKDSMAKIKA